MEALRRADVWLDGAEGDGAGAEIAVAMAHMQVWEAQRLVEEREAEVREAQAALQAAERRRLREAQRAELGTAIEALQGAGDRGPSQAGGEAVRADRHPQQQ